VQGSAAAIGAPDETRTVEIVFPTDTHSMGTLFGGRALSLMDRLAFVVASRKGHFVLVAVGDDGHPVPLSPAEALGGGVCGGGSA
jgi:acyl-CoA hydrolase